MVITTWLDQLTLEFLVLAKLNLNTLFLVPLHLLMTFQMSSEKKLKLVRMLLDIKWMANGEILPLELRKLKLKESLNLSLILFIQLIEDP